MTGPTAFRAAVAASAVLALALTSCSSSKSSGSTDGNGAPSKLSISTAGGKLTIFAPLWAAEADLTQVAKKFHTSISYQPYGSGGDALTAQLGGSVNVGTGASATQVLKAAAQGKGLSYVANIFRGGGVVLVGAKTYESARGTDLSKYNGSKWGYTSEGSSSQVFMAAAADHAGATWDKQKHIALGSITAYEPALQSKRVDIVAMDPGSAAKSIKDGVGYAVLNTNVADQFGPVAGTVLDNGIVFSKDFRSKYPKLAQAIVTAFIKGLNRIRNITDPAQAYAALPADFQKEHPDRALFALEWQLSQPAFSQSNGTSPPKAVADTEKLALKPGDADKPAVKAVFDNALVLEAYKQLGLPAPSETAGG